jgi:hypothetical protein
MKIEAKKAVRSLLDGVGTTRLMKYEYRIIEFVQKNINLFPL